LKSLRILVVAGVCCLASLAGCGGGSGSSGGGSGGGPSLTQQIDNAVKRSDPAQKSRELVPLALKQQQGGDLNGAEKTMRMAAEAARNIPEATSKAARLNAVAGGFGQIDLPDEVKGVLKEVREAIDAIHDEPARVGPLAELGANYGLYAKSQASSEAAFREAEEIARGVELTRDRIRALNQVAFGWSRVKNTENGERLIGDATELANGLEDAREKAECLADVARTLQRMQKPEQAEKLYAEAEAAAGQIERPESQAYALLYLADKRLLAGQRGEAQKLVEKADELTRNIKDGSIRGPLQEKVDETRRRV
jgi:tetratricopeptide (TPR) repeat protein